MASVTFKIYKGADFNDSGDKSTWTPTYKEGQIIFVKEQKKIYLDFDGVRTCYTPDVSSLSSGMNYLGIAKNKPSDQNVTLIDNTSVTAKEKDMVVVGTKEYIYRKDKNGVLGWFEIGDEEAPTWNE